MIWFCIAGVFLIIGCVEYVPSSAPQPEPNPLSTQVVDAQLAAIQAEVDALLEDE